MNELVRITKDDFGEVIENAEWCLMVNRGGGNQNLCEGQFVGVGESACDFDVKVVQRGGITCEKCLQEIREIKAVKL